MITMTTRLALGATILGVGMFLPLRFDARSAVAPNEACGEITCCTETGSLCGILEDHTPHHYRTAGGVCPGT